MDPLITSIITLLLKNGVFGILAGIGFYLYFKERKISQKYTETYLEHQVADTAAKVKLTTTLEAFATTLETTEKYIKKYIEEQRLKTAREEGRRETLEDHHVP